MFNHLMGAKLKEFRLQSGLSIASAAATVGVTSSFISMVENGKSGISLQKVHALLALYGKTLSDLTTASSSESRIINLSSAPEALSEPGVKVFCLAKAEDPYYLGGFYLYFEPGAWFEYDHHGGLEYVLVLEGIHGLNEKLTWSLPSESKFRIYISALTQINVDEHNRIPTTDGRLIRRMVRDSRTRATSAKETIAMWPSVRRGEDRNIFPNQEKADVMFNSALVYELSVLKLYAEPLLFQIEEGEPEYQEAKRLLKFLDYFVGVPIEDIPKNSILREFVGGSCFDV